MKRFFLIVAIACLLGMVNAQLSYNEEEITITNGSISLSGTLTLPEGTGPFPALVLISGSGPQNRDEEISIVPGYQPFRWIAEHLAKEGFAVLRYDDRGTGKSTGDFVTATTADFATDAEAALHYLIYREEIDPLQVGLLGHSEGGIIAAMLAAQNPQVAFVISVAGSSVPGAQLLPVQAKRGLEAEQVPLEKATAILVQQQAEIDFIVSRDWETLEKNIYEHYLNTLAAEEHEALGDLEAAAKVKTEESMVILQGWLYFFLTYDPAQDWANVNVPVLAIFGGLDTQVDVAQNRPVLESALAKAGNKDVTILELAKANHLFQEATTGAASEYPQLDMEFIAGFLEAISSWLHEHTTNVAGLEF